MKKKMLFMAALAGAVTLASCVKNDELASVQAVRTAKANQLNADAARLNAQVLYIAAQTAYEQADAAHRQAQARQEAVTAAINEATQASEIDKQLAQYKVDAAQQAASLQTQLNNLANLVRAESQAERTDLNAIYTDLNTAVTAYTGLLNTYNAAVVAITTQKANLAKAKVDASTALQTQAQNIANAEQSIKESQALIDQYKALEATGKTNQEIQNDYDAKNAELCEDQSRLDNSDAVKTFLTASNNYATMFAAYDEYTDFTASILPMGLIDKANSFGYNVFVNNGNENVPEVTTKFYDKYIAYYSQAGGEQIDPNFNDGGFAGNINKFRVDEGVYNTAITDLNATIDNRQTALDNDKDELGTENDTKDTKRKINKTYDPTLYAQLALFKDSVTNSKIRLDAEIANFDAAKAELATADALADTDPTKAGKQIAAKKKMGDALKEIYGDNGTIFVDPTNPTAAEVENYINLYGINTPIKAEDFDKTFDDFYLTLWYNTYNILYRQDSSRPNNGLQFIYDDARWNVADMTQQIADKKETIAGDEQLLANAKKGLADFEEAFKAVDLTAYETICSDLKASLEAFNKAAEALEKEEDAVDELASEVTAMALVLGTGQDISDLIGQEEANIALQKQNIAAWEAASNPDEIIAQAEADLQQAENNLEVLQARLDAAKKRIEDLIAKAAEAEGDDETGPLDGDDDDAVGPVEGEGGEG